MTTQAFQMLTMAGALHRAARLFASRPAILDGERILTWSGFADRVARAGAVLAALGVRAGDRFAIISRNSFRCAELINAGYWIGAVPVPVNHRLAAGEIRLLLEDAQCAMVAVEERFAGMLDDEALQPWRARALHVAPRASAGGRPQYEPLLASSRPAAMHESRPDDDALLLFTGATSGRSKGVRLSHANIIWNAMQFAIATRAGVNDRFLHVSPMFHSADLVGTAFTLTGAAHAYLDDVSGATVVDAIRRHRITVTMLAPTVLVMALDEPEFEGGAFRDLRLVCYGSAPLAVKVITKAMHRLPAAGFAQCYGLTETAPILTVLPPEDHRRAIESGEHEHLQSVGKSLLHVDIRIADDDGRDVAEGGSGEILVRGPNVSAGYLGMPEATAQAFRDGWFHTGDIGRIDSDGYLYIRDRKKDMIITGSENVYSTEVEAALCRHAGVREAAVIGIPDEKWGEAVFAVIVPAPGRRPTEGELISHCRRHIGGFKIPRRMAFVEALPRSAVGKVLKRELRRTYAAPPGGSGGTISTAGLNP
jgi:long-chain acyl-CoA synthetase